jgi:hypothetical protein
MAPEVLNVHGRNETRTVVPDRNEQSDHASANRNLSRPEKCYGNGLNMWAYYTRQTSNGKAKKPAEMNKNTRLKESASIGESISWGAGILSQAGVPEARREAGSLLAHVLKSGRTHLISHSDELIDHEKLEKFKEYLQRRAAGEPLQDITGIQDFFGL